MAFRFYYLGKFWVKFQKVNISEKSETTFYSWGSKVHALPVQVEFKFR